MRGLSTERKITAVTCFPFLRELVQQPDTGFLSWILREAGVQTITWLNMWSRLSLLWCLSGGSIEVKIKYILILVHSMLAMIYTKKNKSCLFHWWHIILHKKYPILKFKKYGNFSILFWNLFPDSALIFGLTAIVLAFPTWK